MPDISCTGHNPPGTTCTGDPTNDPEATMPSRRSFARWFSWEAWETNKLRKDLAEQNGPQGKYQRLPDGTWGYPPAAPADNGAAQAAYERGWREGWTAGYQAAKEQPPQ